MKRNRNLAHTGANYTVQQNWKVRGVTNGRARPCANGQTFMGDTREGNNSGGNFKSFIDNLVVELHTTLF